MKKAITLVLCSMGPVLLSQKPFSETRIYKILKDQRDEQSLPLAKTTATVQHVDSTLFWQWNPNQLNWDANPYKKRDLFTYDSNDRLTSRVEMGGTPWSNSFKEDYTYDNNNNLTSTSSYHWNGSTWENGNKQTWTYNAANKIIDRAFFNGPGNTWTGQWHYMYTYNSGQDLSLELHQVWTNNAWQDFEKTIFTYDASHNNLTTTVQTWTNSTWVNSHKDTYAYNGAGAVTSYTEQTWNGSAWVNSTKQIINYDLGNDPVDFFGQVWNNNTWENDAQATFTCTNHDIVREEWQYWDGNTWINDDIYTYTFTPTHKELQSIHYTWGGTSYGNWAKYVHTYNAHGDQLTYKYFSWNNNAWLQVFSDSWKYDANNFNYCTVNRSIYGPGYGDSTYTYYKTVVGLKENAFKENTLIVYPNPGKGIFTLETKENTGKVEVFDMVGKTIYQGKIESLNTKLNLVDVPKGIYIVVVTQGKTRETVKIALE